MMVIPGEQTDSIHAPIGLKIGSQTPEEIAVSIAAEIIQEKNAKQISSMSAELSTVRETGVLCMITEKYGSAPRGIGSGMFVYRIQSLRSGRRRAWHDLRRRCKDSLFSNLFLTIIDILISIYHVMKF